MPSETSIKDPQLMALNQKFKELNHEAALLIQTYGATPLFHQLQVAVGFAIEDNYPKIQAEMQGDGLESEPESLPQLLGKLDPAQTIKALYLQNPHLPWSDPTADPVSIALEVVSFLADSN